MPDETQVEALAEAVQANRKYANITATLVQRLSLSALERGLSGKAAVKDVRNKLHQVGGAYFKQHPDYAAAMSHLASLPHDLHSPEVKSFCQAQMQLHASTAERVSILPEFFQTCLLPIAPVTSVLDLACGLNPLALPWMPLAEGATYQACDIYLDMMSFVDSFLGHYLPHSQTFPCDLVAGPPQTQVQVAFLLKTIPCLEQVDKQIGPSLLDQIQADHILVSFPAKSLGGRNKGMPGFYRDHFYTLIGDQPWQVQEFNFTTEIAFLVSK
ncbi:MAG: 16S rRNA methyltransferase [Anaerolineaceae bacterium]|nr:16S rRNA methyltransferase [Anaerolineaceae bacterium]